MFDLTFHPEFEMVLADTLLHYQPQSAPEIELDITISYVKLATENKIAMQSTTAADP